LGLPFADVERQSGVMFIRRTNTRNGKTGEEYFTFRLVESVRIGGAVRQRTLLNLGAHFDLPQPEWSALSARIDELLRGQTSLVTVSPAVEALAQRYAARMIAWPGRQSLAEADRPTAPADRFQDVDIDSLEVIRPRCVGVEHAALTTLRRLGIEGKLADLGLSKPQIAAAVGNIIGRMAAPASELATFEWLRHRTALGELIGYDYEGMDLQQLYRSADNLLKHRETIEAHIFGAAKSLFDINETITLYDLTNTYFEGVATGIGKAKRGRSKEKRSDCPLVTLGLVLDVSGFPKRSRVFAGNAGEAGTLQEMLLGLAAPPGATVVMDAGIASEENLAWLTGQGHRYVVVSRKQTRIFDPDKATEVPTTNGVPVQVHRVHETGSQEARIYCYSPARAEKDRAIDTKKADFFEAELTKLAAGLTKPRATKNPGKIRERIGRAREKYARAAQHYTVDVALDETGKIVTAITWKKAPKPNSSMANPGVYCLRTTLTEPDDATLWRIYSMLTNLEAVFRSLKTDLGIRPVYHRIDRRVEGHLFISLLAYCVVHAMRLRLKASGLNGSWETIRNTLSNQVRVTTTLKRRDGSTIHVRKASRPEQHQQEIYTALELSANPGGTHKIIV
jgi:transposase